MSITSYLLCICLLNSRTNICIHRLLPVNYDYIMASSSYIAKHMNTLKHVFRNYPFLCEAPLRWGDMDAYGHLNNTKFIQIFVCVFSMFTAPIQLMLWKWGAFSFSSFSLPLGNWKNHILQHLLAFLEGLTL